MKLKTIITLLFALTWISAYTQDSFFTFFSNPLNAYFGDMMEDENGNFLAVGQQRIFNDFNTNSGTLWRINQQGDTLTRNFIHGADTSTGFTNIFQSEGYYCTIFGGITIRNEQTFGFTMILHLDSSLNVVEKKYFTPMGTIGASTQVLVKLKESYYCLGNAVTTNGIAQYAIMKLNQDFNITGFQTYSFNSSGSVYGNFSSAIISPDSTQIWAFGYGLTPDDQSSCDMVVFDTLLNLVEIKPFPVGEYPHWSQYINSVTASWISDSTFLTGGSFWYQNYPDPSQFDIGFCEFDSSMAYRPVTVFGANDTIEDGGYFGTFDFIISDSIFFTSTKRTGTGLYPTTPSWIHVGLLNRNLQPYYQRYFGGDAYYWVHKIIATSDGGALIAGNRYDHLTQGYERDVFFLKVNNEGLVTTAPHEPYCPYLPFSVYPNPGSNYPFIYLASQKALLRVFNVSGQLMKTMHLIEGVNQADFSMLPVGSYILSIVNPNGEVFSKRWIKN
jgi:hypothetical protein